MASSPEHEYKTSTETPTSERSGEPKENPFIKFRRFADAHVGSILQGIIGLPSTFSRAGANPRWADFDEDMRRRDELQAKQRQLKEADGWERTEGQEGDQINDPKEQDRNELLSERQRGLLGNFSSQEAGGRDIPLYSPVTKALFAHLGATDSRDWEPVKFSSHTMNRLRRQYLPFEILQGQTPADTVQEVQHMVYNDLNRFVFLRSDYSLLPYLLFSPYSPIRLESTASDAWSAKTPGQSSSSLDTLPYRAAFEDLLHTAHGAPQGSYRHWQPFHWLHSPFGGSSAQSVSLMGWIHDLYGTNLLQRREPAEMAPFVPGEREWHMSPSAKMKSSILHAELQEHGVNGREPATNPQTEQEMYDEFAQWASSPSAMFGSLFSLAQDPKRWLDSKMKIIKSEEGQRVARKVAEETLPTELMEVLKSSPKAIHELIEQVQKEEARNPKGLLDEVEQLKSILRWITESEHGDNDFQSPGSAWNSVPDMPTPASKSALASSSPALAETSDEHGRVVSTSTTTEQTTHEDGSTETNVTVWKRYSDGRETTTTTNHFANPACDENGNPVTSTTVKATGAMETDQKDKKGWFWS